MEFQRDGSLRLGSITQVPKKVGTAVAIYGNLEAVPVRRADLIRRIIEQQRKVLRLVAGYAIFSPGVKMQLIDICRRSKKEETRLATPANSKSLRETIAALFGSKYLATLSEFTVDLGDVLL